MKRTLLIRLSAVAAVIALIASCDQRTPVTANIHGGGSTGGGNPSAPAVSIDTVQPSPVNVGDSILVAVHVRDDSAIVNLNIHGFTVHGSVDLGTLQVYDRYIPVSAPAGGAFRSGLRDTVIRRYLKPGVPIDTTLDSLVIIATASDGPNTGADTAVVRVVTGPKVNFIDLTAKQIVDYARKVDQRQAAARLVHGRGAQLRQLGENVGHRPLTTWGVTRWNASA